ncbi:MAG TPA: hypothetical protein ENL09_00205 [Bacteroidetes bacterium]|nr:hypothetical protein [Bacteroidota bacterium]
MYDINHKTAKEKLGEKYNELLEKDWKVAEIPEDYECKKGKDGRKLNKNSLKNLVQYRKRSKKEKQVALEQLRFKEKKDVPKKKRGRPPKKKKKEVESSVGERKRLILERLTEAIPLEEIFHEEELKIFLDYLEVYLKDFEDQELSGSDMDDIISIATNRVLELRLLRHSKSKASVQVQVSTSIEKLRKQTEKLKENLAARRRDRMKGSKHDFTIVDLVMLYEQNKDTMFKDRAKRLLDEEQEYLTSRQPHGNKEDVV